MDFLSYPLRPKTCSSDLYAAVEVAKFCATKVWSSLVPATQRRRGEIIFYLDDLWCYLEQELLAFSTNAGYALLKCHVSLVRLLKVSCFMKFVTPTPILPSVVQSKQPEWLVCHHQQCCGSGNGWFHLNLNYCTSDRRKLRFIGSWLCEIYKNRMKG